MCWRPGRDNQVGCWSFIRLRMAGGQLAHHRPSVKHRCALGQNRTGNVFLVFWFFEDSLEKRRWAERRSGARLFAGAVRVRYAWRPAGPRAMARRLGPAARRPPRIGRRDLSLSARKLANPSPKTELAYGELSEDPEEAFSCPTEDLKQPWIRGGRLRVPPLEFGHRHGPDYRSC